MADGLGILGIENEVLEDGIKIQGGRLYVIDRARSI
jgi:hypothetical protein